MPSLTNFIGDIVVLCCKPTKNTLMLKYFHVVLISFTLLTIISNLFDFYGFVLYNKINTYILLIIHILIL